MIQIDLNFIVELLKKYSGWVAFAILLLMNTCGSDTDHSGVIALREKENSTLNRKVDSLFKVNLSKDKIIAKAEKKATESESKIDDLNKEILAERKSGAKELSKVKNYELAEWKTFYQERTQLSDKDISVQTNTLNFTKPPLTIIATDLIKGDVAKAELKLKNGVISEKDTIIFQKDKIIETEREKSLNLLSIHQADNTIISNLNENVSDLKTDLKKANKIKLKPIIISAVLGGLVGATISK